MGVFSTPRFTHARTSLPRDAARIASARRLASSCRGRAHHGGAEQRRGVHQRLPGQPGVVQPLERLGCVWGVNVVCGLGNGWLVD